MKNENRNLKSNRKNSNSSSYKNKRKSKEKENTQRKNYLERELLFEMENKLIEKVFKDLSNKYNILIKEKKYNIIKFKKDLIYIMKKNYNFNDPNPDYKQFFKNIEKTFLKEINDIDDKNIYNDTELNNDNEEREKQREKQREREYSFEKINLKEDGFIEYKRKFSLSNKNRPNSNSNSISINNIKKNNNNEKKYVLNNENENNFINKVFNPLRNELVRKQTFDDWAKIINADSKNLLKEIEESKKKKNINKSSYKNSLFEQMQEKKSIEKLKKEEENFFIKEIFQGNLKKMEKKEKENNDKKNELLKKNIEYSKKELNGNQ